METSPKASEGVQQDIAGDNKKLQTKCDQAAGKLNIQVESTFNDTNKQNYFPELGFTTNAARARAVMSHAYLIQNSSLLLCKGAFQTATKLDDLPIIQDMKILVKKHTFSCSLETIGEVGAVKIVKVENWGLLSSLYVSQLLT